MLADYFDKNLINHLWTFRTSSILSRKDFKKFADKVVNEGALIGWVHAEKMTRQRMEKKIDLLEQEINILRDRVKEVEVELLASQG